MIGYWHHHVARLSVCLSVCNAVLIYHNSTTRQAQNHKKGTLSQQLANSAEEPYQFIFTIKQSENGNL